MAEVKVVEGTIPPQDAVTIDPYTGEETNFFELLLPDNLVALTDRCDACGAQALHGFVVDAKTEVPMSSCVLLMCNHCARTNHNDGMEYLAHKDYREPYDKFMARIEAEKAEALKLIAAGKLDDSNYSANGTGSARWQAQWDLNYWAKR